MGDPMDHSGVQLAMALPQAIEMLFGKLPSQFIYNSLAKEHPRHKDGIGKKLVELHETDEENHFDFTVQDVVYEQFFAWFINEVLVPWINLDLIYDPDRGEKPKQIGLENVENWKMTAVLHVCWDFLNIHELIGSDLMNVSFDAGDIFPEKNSYRSRDARVYDFFAKIIDHEDAGYETEYLTPAIYPLIRDLYVRDQQPYPKSEIEFHRLLRRTLLKAMAFNRMRRIWSGEVSERALALARRMIDSLPEDAKRVMHIWIGRNYPPGTDVFDLPEKLDIPFDRVLEILRNAPVWLRDHKLVPQVRLFFTDPTEIWKMYVLEVIPEEEKEEKAD